ncbi:MAG: sigma-54 dependent transcriptional regulator [Candidatus Poribacteria bacterium]|nr:sigma-54 dependent transcriptional regulator [Candidatus Poribacteria bacterium]
MSDAPTILIVDDDTTERETIGRIFRNEGYGILDAADGASALEMLEDHRVTVLLTDLKMPGIDGMELLEQAQALQPGIQVIVMTGYGSVEGAVEAMHAGAADFLQKPLDVQTTRARVRKAIEKHRLQATNLALQEQLDRTSGLDNMIGRSAAMESVYRMVRRVAPTNATALILGDSGTGKELIAHAIHHLSPRKDRRFLAFNCAAVTRELVESELFGYNRGAFTGAVRDKPGYFEEANGGTLFLDEIGEMTVEAQAKLLRVLEEREIMRVGGTKAIPIDVRIIAATNRNLAEWVANGKFREDLFYRINVFPIEIPPLRERRGDIPLLAEHFLRQSSEEHGVSPKRFDRAAMEALQAHEWSGNVRELRNLVSYLTLSAEDDVITPADLPDAITSKAAPTSGGDGFRVGMTMEDMEREAILQTLDAADGNKTKAAKLLGIGLRTLYRKLESYGVGTEDES